MQTLTHGQPSIEVLWRRFVIGAGATIAVALWLGAAAPSDERASSNGFDLRPVIVRRQAPAPARDPMPRPADPLMPVLTAAPSASSIAEGVAASAKPQAAPEPQIPGVSNDAAGMAKLGGQKGLLSSLAVKMIDHPNVLKAIFNNKRVVDAFMSREVTRRNCQSAGALTSYLSDGRNKAVTNTMPIIRSLLSKPATASALAGTEMAKRLLDCPSVHSMTKQPSALMSIAVSNPAVMGLLSDSRTAQALAANPQALGLLSGIQSSMGKL